MIWASTLNCNCIKHQYFAIHILSLCSYPLLAQVLTSKAWYVFVILFGFGEHVDLIWFCFYISILKSIYIYRLRKLQKRLLRVLGLTELLIFCSNFVLGPFVWLWFCSNLILIFCLLCNEYVLFILLCMFNFWFFWVGSIMVLWWDLSFVVIGFVIVSCVVESINQSHQTLVLCHFICRF